MIRLAIHPKLGNAIGILKRALGFLFLTVCPLVAQPPQADVVEEGALVADPGGDFYLRGKNLYDAAQAEKDEKLKRDLLIRSEEIFTEYLALFPKHENAQKAWWYLGNSHHQLGDPGQAKRCFSTILNRYDEGKWVAAAAYTLAADHYNSANYAMAAPLFAKYAKNVESPADRAKGQFFEANCYRVTAQDNQAIKTFKEVLGNEEAGPYKFQSMASLGHLSVKLGKMEDALGYFEQVIAAEVPDKLKGEAMLHAGLVALKLDNQEAANKHLYAVLNNDAFNLYWADAQSALMSHRFKAGDYKAVLELAKKEGVVAVGEKEASRLMLIARSHLRLDQPKEALELFRQVEKLVKPETDIAFQASFYRLMCFFEIEGRHIPEQVDAFLQLYAKSRPDDLRIHTALMMKAETLYEAGDIAAAAQVYAQVNDKRVSDKNRPGLLYKRGWCLAQAGDSIGAIHSLSQFIKDYTEDSRFDSALAKRAKVFAESAKTGPAIADFDRLIERTKSQELLSFAWLESARVRRGESQIEDMIRRYQGLLKAVKDLNDNLKSEANYWIGWGLVKSNKAKESVEYLTQARKLRPDAYDKHAGILLALGYFAMQDADRLAEEVSLSIEKKYSSDIPPQAIQWSGMQSFNAGKFEQTTQFLSLIATPDEPRATAKEIWRYLAKAYLQTDKYENALEAALNVLAVEENLAWRADGMLDQGKALFELERYDESRKVVEDALALQPQGKTRGGLRILAGDLEMQAGDPSKASAQYLIVVSFIDDGDLKPRALHKLIKALEAQQEETEAAKYRDQLKTEFPDWKPE